MTEFDELNGEDENSEIKSKSQLKREMHELQSFATSLTQLKSVQLDALGLPDKLRRAIDDYRKISKSHIARKRHTQYLGKLMKGLDSDALAKQINRLKDSPAKKESPGEWASELALELLQQGDERINTLLRDYPELERPTLRKYHREYLKAKAEDQLKICIKLSKYLGTNIEH